MCGYDNHDALSCAVGMRRTDDMNLELNLCMPVNICPGCSHPNCPGTAVEYTPTSNPELTADMPINNRVFLTTTDAGSYCTEPTVIAQDGDCSD